MLIQQIETQHAHSNYHQRLLDLYTIIIKQCNNLIISMQPPTNQVIPIQIDMPGNAETWTQEFDLYIKRLVQEYYHKLANDAISSQQMKLQLSKDILNVFVSHQGMQSMSQQDYKEFSKRFQILLKKNLEFLGELYPRNIKIIVSQEILDAFQEYDGTDTVQADMLTRFNFKFDIDEDSNEVKLLKQIQKFCNKLIDASKQFFPIFIDFFIKQLPLEMKQPETKQQYEELIDDITKFKLSCKLPENHPEIVELAEEKFTLPSKQIFRIFEKWIKNLDEFIQNPEAILTKRRFLKKKVAVSQTQTEKSHQQSQQSPSNQSPQKIKSDSCFKRILSRRRSPTSKSPKPKKEHVSIKKDFENQVNKIAKRYQTKSNIEQQLYRFENFRYRILGSSVNVYVEAFKDIKLNGYKCFKFQQEQYLRGKHWEILKIVAKNKKIGKLTENQKKLYSFSNCTYKVMEQILIKRLLYVIKTIVNFRKNLNTLQNYDLLKDIYLVEFKVNDLLRASIKGNQKMLLQIYNALQRMHDQKRIKIIRVKNRFREPLCDAMVIFIMGQCQLNCQLQLILTGYEEQKQQLKIKAQEQIHHYLYELKRAGYGPLTELGTIVSRDFRTSYLDVIKNHQYNHTQLQCYCPLPKPIMQMINESQVYRDYDRKLPIFLFKDGQINVEGYKKILPKTFICVNCEEIYKKNQEYFPIKKCKDCIFQICSECNFQNDKKEEISFYIDMLNAVIGYKDQQLKLYFHVEGQNTLKQKKRPKGQYPLKQQQREIGQNLLRIGVHENIIRARQGMGNKQFWSQARKIIQESKVQLQAEQKKKRYCILLSPRLIPSFTQKPFRLLQYDFDTKQFLEYELFGLGGDQVRLNKQEISENEMTVNYCDALLITRYSKTNQDIIEQIATMILRENVFCKRKPIPSELSDAQKFIRKIKSGSLNMYIEEIQLRDDQIKQINLDYISMQLGPKQRKFLKNLKFINLNKNKIEKLDYLQKLEHLEDLSVSYNAITELKLTKNSFPSLQILYVDDNEIKCLTIKEHQKLKILSAKNNSFERIQLNNLKKLKSLALSKKGQNILVPTSVVLTQLKKVQDLYLSMIKVENQQFMKQFTNLDKLELLNCDIPIYPSIIANLIITSNNKNQIKLSKISGIRKMKLKEVNIDTITISSESQVLSINYDTVQDQSIPHFIAPKLKSLEISSYTLGEKLNELDLQNFAHSQMPNLESLALVFIGNDPGCKMTDFSPFKNLRYLTIMSCLKQVNDLPQKLQELRISSQNKRQRGLITPQPLRDARTYFRQNFNLKADLTNSKLKLIELNGIQMKTFTIPNKCSFLYLHNNKMTKLRLNTTNSLEKLVISKNQLRQQDLSILEYSKLLGLKLTDMNIRELRLKSMKDLKRLDLSNNCIDNIQWIKKQVFENLQKLNVSWNKIQKLEIDSFKHLKYLLASNNPLNLNYLCFYFESNSQSLSSLFTNLQTLSIFPVLIQGFQYDSSSLETQVTNRLDSTVSKLFANFSALK